jgi:hypothetical protein
MANLVYSNDYRYALNFMLDSTLPLHTFVKISGEYAVSKADAGDFTIGCIESRPITYPGNCAVTTKFNHIFEVPAAEALAAGDLLKIGADSGTGEQRFAKYIAGTDSPNLIVGVCLTAANAADAVFDGLFI